MTTTTTTCLVTAEMTRMMVRASKSTSRRNLLPDHMSRKLESSRKLKIVL